MKDKGNVMRGVVMNIREVIEEIPIFEQSNSVSKSKIMDYAVIRKFKKGKQIFRMSEEVNQVYVIEKGYVVVERVNNNNDTRGIFVLGPGELINEVILQKETASISCEALTDLVLISISKERFLEIMEQDFVFTKAVIDSMSLKIRRLYHQIENTTKMMRLERQVASRIWKLARDHGVPCEEGIKLPFDLSITMLAELVGSNRESVSRIVKKLSEEGLVSIANGKCKIYDMNKLKAVNCDGSTKK